MITRWRIWYDDGSTFSSEDGSPEDAPVDGIQAVGEEDDTGKRQIYWGRDFYQWTGDGWRAGDQADLERWLRRDCPRIKFGLWAPNSVWQKLRVLVRREWI